MLFRTSRIKIKSIVVNDDYGNECDDEEDEDGDRDDVHDKAAPLIEHHLYQQQHSRTTINIYIYTFIQTSTPHFTPVS